MEKVRPGTGREAGLGHVVSDQRSNLLNLAADFSALVMRLPRHCVPRNDRENRSDGITSVNQNIPESESPLVYCYTKR